MIKLKTTGPNGPLVILGLSEENLKRLREDKPIHFQLAELGLGDGEFLLFAGKTEAAMIDQLAKAGLIDPADVPAAKAAAAKPKPRH